MKSIKLILTLLIVLASTGCSEVDTKETLVIYTTNYAQKFIIEAIGQEYVDAYSVYDNTDEFSIKDSENFVYEVRNPEEFSLDDHKELKQSILESDLFIYNGKSTKDNNIINDIVSEDESEDLPVLDSTKNADISTVAKNMGLSYDNKTVEDGLLNTISSNEELEMFWLSPIEMQNVSTEIYSFLIDAMPERKEALKKNFDVLMYELDALYADIEEISSTTVNNIIVSDSFQLDVIKIHYIQNVYTDHTKTELYSGDEDNTNYMNDVSKYIQINEQLKISTTDPNNPNYFDLAEVQSVQNYENGVNYYEIMHENYETLRNVLK